MLHQCFRLVLNLADIVDFFSCEPATGTQSIIIQHLTVCCDVKVFQVPQVVFVLFLEGLYLDTALTQGVLDVIEVGDVGFSVNELKLFDLLHTLEE